MIGGSGSRPGLGFTNKNLIAMVRKKEVKRRREILARTALMRRYLCEG